VSWKNHEAKPTTTLMLTRRAFLKSLAGFSAMGLGTASYAGIIEPGFMLNTTAYAFTPPGWTPGLKLRAVLIADPHIVEPWFNLNRWRNVLSAAQALQPDVFLLLGDYISGITYRSGTVPPKAIAAEVANLRSPLGTFAINGNHDWWGDHEAQRLRKGPPAMQIALEDAGISVLANKAVRLSKDGMPFWITGTDSIISYRNGGNFIGTDDLDGTLAQVKDAGPVIHMAHEPDMFVRMPERVSLTLSGHTHGGQIRVGGYAPWVPSAFGRRFLYGHLVEEGRHIIVSGGLGCSTLPVRLGAPPEINLLELG